MFANLRHLRDLMYYEGAFFEHVINDKDQDYLVLWLDCVADPSPSNPFHRTDVRIIYEATRDTVVDILAGRMSIRDSVRMANAICMFNGYYSDPKNIRPVAFDQLPLECIAAEGVCLCSITDDEDD